MQDNGKYRKSIILVPIIVRLRTPPPYGPHAYAEAKKIVIRNCKHLRKNKLCELCPEYDARDNTCKIGVPATWK